MTKKVKKITAPKLAKHETVLMQNVGKAIISGAPASDKIKHADAMLSLSLMEVRGLDKQHKTLGKLLESRKNVIKAAMGDCEELYDTDGTLGCTYKVGADRLKFREKDFAEHYPELYAEFCDTVAGNRVFLIK